MSMIPYPLDAAQSTYLVTPSTCDAHVSTTIQVGVTTSKQLTTQALLGSMVLFRGSGCARSSGLSLSVVHIVSSKAR